MNKAKKVVEFYTLTNILYSYFDCNSIAKNKKCIQKIIIFCDKNR